MIKDERGISLVEVLIALAILALVAVAFLSGLATASKALIIADERTTAESLAKSQMEYVKDCEYDDINNPPQYEIDPDLDIPDGYDIEITAERLDPKGDGTDNDDGIQKITLVVEHYGEAVFIFIEDDKKITLEGYKVDR